MSALAWWLIPLVATVLAVAFVVLRSRPAKPSTADDGMDRMRRMQQAMERPLPGSDVPVDPRTSSSDPGPSDPRDRE